MGQAKRDSVGTGHVALLVATAKVHGPVLVTRNAAGVAGLDVDVQNPFEA
ncbi:MAG: type II toxin-antitoxin system VapC family toxin [Boseongicola sp. SB0664_bin_43]|uniref:Type II toxin-antitoxin system VapC family toxin n=1 Tax=Boseongicola sp. SB0664_bin_43 TaxID=2604844 RepID=A0A6B0Y139_9RHOB|nr:type II toxin-antitoxin system VapC family toxin [Boseongicola sp. SB0664_bin_43]MYK31068.1 type II toxin-antitoxin system VapC family toxin [Boseongicola sp. SB0670_bin_30]